ncbi:hypothetical protein ABZ371_09655 [Streptomyces sp. NPDC005899]
MHEQGKLWVLLGRHRRVVGRTMSWLAGCRHPHRRYELSEVLVG